MCARKYSCALIYVCHASSNGPCVCAINAESLRRDYNLGENDCATDYACTRARPTRHVVPTFICVCSKIGMQQNQYIDFKNYLKLVQQIKQ